ncbi:hypothetical protein F0238_21290 [Vibrio coralliilyticus]|uniref:Uncharacterized protein n=2 Tax=Vibrio coralliilyticus TaxID=190893 RepID=A0AAP6ZV84_9VIBR|nr:hypothetical protein [Vibrio coralliilyticus]NOI31820.1 hypothetical protein [Vibrio coralliilyticus]NOJ25263.1 hypothetical protein [Vibrio coralliilyticus]
MVLHEHLARLCESKPTPLRDLCLKIPVRYWSMFKGIELNRKIGFKTAMRHPSLHQLMRYIGWNEKVKQGDTLPYELYIDRDVKSVTLDDLLDCCEKKPDDNFVRLIRLSMEKCK